MYALCEPIFKSVCLAGTYRSPDEPQYECNSCPINTVRDEVGATICECLDRYFRDEQTNEGPEVGCTRKLHV